MSQHDSRFGAKPLPELSPIHLSLFNLGGALVKSPRQIRRFNAVFIDSVSRFQEDRVEAISQRRAGRCIRHHERPASDEALKAISAPLLQRLPTDAERQPWCRTAD